MNWGDSREVRNLFGSSVSQELMFVGHIIVKIAHILQSRNWQSTMICLFNDYDLPLACKSFITMTHLGQEKWALRSNTGHCPLVNHNNGSHPFSDFKPQDFNTSFSHVSHIPTTSFLLNVASILPLLWYIKWFGSRLNRMAAVAWGSL